MVVWRNWRMNVRCLGWKVCGMREEGKGKAESVWRKACLALHDASQDNFPDVCMLEHGYDQLPMPIKIGFGVDEIHEAMAFRQLQKRLHLGIMQAPEQCAEVSADLEFSANGPFPGVFVVRQSAGCKRALRKRFDDRVHS